jgi:5-(carboxyamino)imidazole ribonucleotide synthase
MVNLFGDLWDAVGAPDWKLIVRHPRAKLHLYGKLEPRPGRKMGHYCVLGETIEAALSQALDIRQALIHNKELRYQSASDPLAGGPL